MMDAKRRPMPLFEASVFDTEQTVAVTLLLDRYFAGFYCYCFRRSDSVWRRGNVQSQPLSHGAKALSHDDDIYCGRCVYCKFLRVAEQAYGESEASGMRERLFQIRLCARQHKNPPPL
jgi:hypothetical protein